MNLGEYLRIAHARWKLIVGCTVAGLGLAALLTVTATPTYESSAELFVSTPQSEAEIAFEGGEYGVTRVTSYANLVGSRELARKVVNELGLDTSPGDLADKVSATVEPGTVSMTITATDSDPVVAEEIAQTTAEQLSLLVTELETPAGDTDAPVSPRIIDPASTPTSPISPSPSRNLALGLLLGFLLGAGLAVVREVLDGRVRRSEDITDATGLPVLGELVYDPRTARSPMDVAYDAQGPYLEGLRVLRTNLQFQPEHGARTITVTSAMPEEGKTLTAVNLAIVLARAEQRVLLIEGDLRRPRIHEHLALDHEVGLTTVLLDRVRLEEAVQECGVRNLDVLTSGEVPSSSAELLQSWRMVDLLDQAAETYDMVVIDAPPLLAVTDAALLTARADGALLVVRHGRTTRDQLRHALARLEAVRGRSIGTVLNASPSRMLAGRYLVDAEADEPTLSIFEPRDEPAAPDATAAAEGTPLGVPGARPHPGDVAAPLPDRNRAGVVSRVRSAATGSFGRPETSDQQGQQVPEQRAEGVRDDVDQLRRPVGKEQRLPGLDQQRPGKAGRQPGRPAPARTKGRPEKTERHE